MRTLCFLFCFGLSTLVRAQMVHSINFEQLQKKILETKDTIIILNFWATWCKPCVEELPYFEQLNQTYLSKKIKVILVNLDFNSKIKSLVEPFIIKKNLKSEILHITDTDPNAWINKLDSTWSGAIPATIFYNSSHEKIKFHEGQMTYDQLESTILPYIK